VVVELGVVKRPLGIAWHGDDDDDDDDSMATLVTQSNVMLLAPYIALITNPCIYEFA
jgi:hypothetical protein